jgi:hypothetical protein
VGTLIDGEIVIADADGCIDFTVLQARLSSARNQVSRIAFERAPFWSPLTHFDVISGGHRAAVGAVGTELQHVGRGISPVGNSQDLVEIGAVSMPCQAVPAGRLGVQRAVGARAR